jgi:hypothetical protein
MNTILQYIVTIAEFVFEKYPANAYLLVIFLLPHMFYLSVI